ncbi:hypothetical protein [Bacillus sp. 1P06AnD]|uniref:hypothetical protein n=1 Tax=Bacillus sp. 1P06AnD TaxID=3132208 RepID=UPI0039A2A766
MLKKMIILSGLLLFLTQGISTYFSLHKVQATTKHLEQYTYELLSSKTLSNLITFVDCQIKDKEILVHVELSEEFSDLSHKANYGYLAYYAKHLRYTLRQDLDVLPFQFYDITIIGNHDNKTYSLHNFIPDKSVKVKTKTNLYINNDLAYSSKHYKIDINRYKTLNPQIVGEDVEIVNYAISLFKKITTGGKYYNHEKDSRAILDSVTKKFGITPDQYTKIYMKYFFLME